MLLRGPRGAPARAAGRDAGAAHRGHRVRRGRHVRSSSPGPSSAATGRATTSSGSSCARAVDRAEASAEQATRSGPASSRGRSRGGASEEEALSTPSASRRGRRRLVSEDAMRTSSAGASLSAAALGRRPAAPAAQSPAGQRRRPARPPPAPAGQPPRPTSSSAGTAASAPARTRSRSRSRKQVAAAFNASAPGHQPQVRGRDRTTRRATRWPPRSPRATAPDIVGPVGVGGADAFDGQWLDLAPLIESTGYDLSQFDRARGRLLQDRRRPDRHPVRDLPVDALVQGRAVRGGRAEPAAARVRRAST